MADYTLVTELVIDASGTIAGADAAVAQLDRVTAASQRAAAAIDRVSAASTAQGAQQGAAAGAAATEAAILRQSTAVEGVAGAMVQLSRTSRELETASIGVSDAIMTGAISAQAGGAELAAYAARQAEVNAAMNALKTGQMDLTNAMVTWPGLLRASGTEAEASAGAITKLSGVSRDLSTEMQRVSDGIMLGTIGAQRGGAELSAYAARQGEVVAMTGALATGQMNVAEAVAAFPNALNSASSATAAMVAQHQKAITALEEFRTGQANVGNAIQRFPGLIGASTQSIKEFGAAHQQAASIVDKFFASGMSASQFLNRYPGLVAASGDATDSMRAKHASLATALDDFRSKGMSANEVLLVMPTLVGAAGTSVGEMAAKHAAVTNTFKEFTDKTISAEQVIQRLPQVATAAGTAALNMATRVATVGPIARGVGAEAEEAGTKISNAWARGNRASEGMVLVHESLAGRWRQFISSMTIELQNFGLMQSIVAGLTNPLILALTAVGAVVIAAGLRLVETAANLRAFGAAIQVTNTQGQVTAPQLQGMVDQLRNMGVGAAEAFKTIHQLSLDPFINPQAAVAIGDVGARLSQLNTGGLDKTAEEAKKVQDAIHGGADAMVKFGRDIGAINGEQAANIKEMQLHEGSIKAVDTAFQLIFQHLPSVRSQVSGARDDVTKLGAAWRELLEAVGKSPIYSSLENLADVFIKSINGIVTAITAAQKFLNSIPGGTPPGPAGSGQPGNLLGLREYIDPAAKAVGNFITGITPLGTFMEGATTPGMGTATTEAAKAETEATKANTVAVTKLTDGIGTLGSNIPAAISSGGITPSGTAPSLAGEGPAATKAIGDYITGTLKLSATQAAAILGQAIQESSLNPLSGEGKSHQGLFQWDPARFQQLQDFAAGINSTWTDWRTQVQFFVKEVGQRTPEFFSAGQSLDKLTGMLTKKVEIPTTAGPDSPQMAAEIANRQRNAQRALVDIGGAAPSVAGGATVQQGEEYLAGLRKEADRLRPTLGLTGQAAEIAAAGLRAEAEAYGHVAGPEQVVAAGKIAEQAVRDKNAATMERETKFQQMETQANLDSVEASKKSEAAGIAQQAIGEALLKTIQRQGTEIKSVTTARSAAFATESDAVRQAAQTLQAKTSQDLISATRSVQAMDLQVSANERLAIATGESAAAGKQAAIENQAESVTHSVATTAVAAHMVAELNLQQAQKSGDAARVAAAQVLVDRTKKELDEANALQSVAVARLSADAALKNAEGLAQATNQLKDQVEQGQLIVSLQGLSTEQIAGRVDMLKAEQKVRNDNINVEKGIAAARALGREDLVKQLETDRDIQTAKEKQYLTETQIDVVTKQQVADAERQTARLNDAARSVADAVNTQIGTALDNAFSGQKAQNWGDTMKTILRDLLKQIVEFTLIQPAIGSALGLLGFSQVAQQFGSFGNLLGGGGTDPISGLSTSNTSGGGGIFSSLGQLGNTFSGLKNLSGLFSGGEGGIFGAGGLLGGPALPSAQALLDFPAAGAVGEGLASSTALSAGGVEAAAGGFSSGIFGAIGSALPFIGIAAGVGSLIGGLFGNKKPSLASSGDILDLASGTVGAFSSSGNAQNDAAVRSMTDTIRQFEQTIQSETGGTVPGGALNIVQTLKGVEVNYAGPLGNIKARFADAQSAINAIETVIAQNLTGVSDTMRTVLAHITDPSQIQAAATFAATYDNLQKTVDQTLKGVAGDITTTVGPFATAMDTLKTQFAGLTQQAQQFGLSLDPINQGLAIATQRLQQDFGRSLDTIIAGQGGGYVGQLQAVSSAFATNVTDAIAIGLGDDSAITAKIQQAEQVQAQAILGGLTVPQLQDVIAKMGQTNPEIAAMAQAIINTGSAATAAGASVQSFASQMQALQNTITSLTSGNLSGLSPAAAAAAAVDTYNKLLAQVRGGDTMKIGDLSTAATTAVTALQTAYGNAPQTSDVRTTILGQLNALLASNPQPTAPVTPAVLAAQQQAAALAAAGKTSLAPGPVAPSAAVPTPAAPAPGAPSPPIGTPSPGDQQATDLAKVQAVYASANRLGISPTAEQQAVLSEYFNKYGTLPSVSGFARGTQATPSGPILVGEAGPELIFQPGGLSIVPISTHDAYQWHGPAFAGGTNDFGQAFSALVGEVVALRRQIQAGQVNADGNAQKHTGYLASLNRKVPGLQPPTRQDLKTA